MFSCSVCRSIEVTEFGHSVYHAFDLVLKDMSNLMRQFCSVTNVRYRNCYVWHIFNVDILIRPIHFNTNTNYIHILLSGTTKAVRSWPPHNIIT